MYPDRFYCDTGIENMTSLIQAVTAWIMGGRIQDEVVDLLDATLHHSRRVTRLLYKTTENYAILSGATPLGLSWQNSEALSILS